MGFSLIGSQSAMFLNSAWMSLLLLWRSMVAFQVYRWRGLVLEWKLGICAASL